MCDHLCPEEDYEGYQVDPNHGDDHPDETSSAKAHGGERSSDT